MKIDKRNTYVMVLDTETCNGIVKPDGSTDLDYSLVYDCGGSIVDTKGNVYEDFSFVIYEMFCGEKRLMKESYFADKIPNYQDEINNGSRQLRRFMTVRKYIHDKIKEYNIKAVVAHNARFDVKALNTTLRYITTSKFRYFFPSNVEIWDTLKMSRCILGKMPTYGKFCLSNGYMTKDKNPKNRYTAEIIYRFINKDNDFIESHTALEDVKIEREILWYCYRQHKPMEKVLYPKSTKAIMPIFAKVYPETLT